MSTDANLLPLRTPVDEPESEPRLVEIDDANGDTVFDALASNTARELLTALYEEPATPSDLTDRVGTSLQNVHYHLERLEDVGLIRTVDTWYSSKGVEMNVYAPSNEPFVLVAGDADSTEACRDVVSGTFDEERPSAEH